MREVFEYSEQVQNKVVFTTKFYTLGNHLTIIYDLNPKNGYDIVIYPSTCDLYNIGGVILNGSQQVVGLLVKLDKNKEAAEVKINRKQNTKSRLEVLDKNNTNDIRYNRFILSDNNRKLDLFLMKLNMLYYNSNITKDDLRPWGETTIAEEGGLKCLQMKNMPRYFVI
jgi:hypothetical protein